MDVRAWIEDDAMERRSSQSSKARLGAWIFGTR